MKKKIYESYDTDSVCCVLRFYGPVNPIALFKKLSS